MVDPERATLLLRRCRRNGSKQGQEHRGGDGRCAHEHDFLPFGALLTTRTRRLWRQPSPTCAVGGWFLRFRARIRLRCVTQPDAAQAALLDRLGAVLPERMRLAEAELPVMPSST